MQAGRGQRALQDGLYWEGFPETSEDCLYLNITTPAATGDEQLPVYLWFHGGGQRHGWSYEPEFNAEELAKKGVIVVTVGQRLGVFGYMALPQLTEEQGTSGNYGNMDQAKAYEWVRENIAAFGGDPDNIVFGGQSGGTTKSMVLELFPDVHAQGMVLHSGLKWFDTFAPLAEAEPMARPTSGTSALILTPRWKSCARWIPTCSSARTWTTTWPTPPAAPSATASTSSIPPLPKLWLRASTRGINILSGTTLGEATGSQGNDGG